jgi:hypothetical protein
MNNLKTLSTEAIPRALEKADRYRLLNEPLFAQSICLDILAIEPENQQALATLILALTDQFSHGYRIEDMDPDSLLPKLTSPYERAYHAGLIAERRATALLDHDAPHSDSLAHDHLTAAMEYFEQAAAIRPRGNDDALLRWNTCARLLDSRGVHPRTNDLAEPFLE